MSEPLASCGHRRVVDESEMIALETSIEQANLRQSLDTGELETYVIPIVFHVLHKGENVGIGTNISDEQIYSAVTQLNRDYSKEPNTNADGLGVDMGIRFVLANKDDDGNFSTGIIRLNGAALSTRYTNDGARSSNKGEYESIFKNWSRWNNRRVLNVWIVSEIEGNNGGSGIQGYAYFPTSSYVDGIVQLYNATGTVGTRKSYTSLSKTLAHEAGHWMALFHTFHNTNNCDPQQPWEGDRCNGENGTPVTIKNSNGNSPACGGTQQVENIMDYTNEKFKNTLVEEQRTRGRLAIENSRPLILHSNAIDNLSLIEADATIEIISPSEYCCPNSEQYLAVSVQNTSSEPIHKIEFIYGINNISQSHVWYGIIPPYGVSEINISKIPTNETAEIDIYMLKINDNLTPDDYDSMVMTIPTENPYTIEIVQDALAGQISWDISRASDLKQLYESPNYKNFKPNELIKHSVCLPEGQYLFTFQDTQAGMQTEGAYLRFLNPDGVILLEETGENGESQIGFTVGQGKTADLNGDGIVNILDASIMNVAFGKSEGDEGYNEDADLNGDGHVNIVDVSILSSKWGTDGKLD